MAIGRAIKSNLSAGEVVSGRVDDYAKHCGRPISPKAADGADENG